MGDERKEGRASSAILAHAHSWVLFWRQIRTGLYNVIQKQSLLYPEAFEAHYALACPAVVAALGERDQGVQPAMWEAVLAFLRACPQAWQHVNFQKASSQVCEHGECLQVCLQDGVALLHEPRFDLTWNLQNLDLCSIPMKCNTCVRDA